MASGPGWIHQEASSQAACFLQASCSPQFALSACYEAQYSALLSLLQVVLIFIMVRQNESDAEFMMGTKPDLEFWGRSVQYW